MSNDSKLSSFGEDTIIHTSTPNLSKDKKSFTFSNLFKREKSNMSNEELKKQNDELKAENQTLTERLLSLEQKFEKLNKPSFPVQNIPAEQTSDTQIILSQVSYNSGKLIQNLMQEVPDYDGTTCPEIFRRELRETISVLETEQEKEIFTRRLVAQKLKGQAQMVARRVRSRGLNDILSALETSFGQIELKYSQLAQQRDNTRQGVNESIKNYVQRYEELFHRIQNSLDSVSSRYRDAFRYAENEEHIEKFISSLKPELEVRVRSKNPTTLRLAFAEAQIIDKKLRDDEILRNNRTPRVNVEQHKQQKFSEKAETNSQLKNMPRKENMPRDSVNPPREQKTNKLNCTYCKKEGHSKERCFLLYPELKSNFPSRTHQAETPPNEDVNEIPPCTSEEPEESMRSMVGW